MSCTGAYNARNATHPANTIPKCGCGCHKEPCLISCGPRCLGEKQPWKSGDDPGWTRASKEELTSRCRRKTSIASRSCKRPRRRAYKTMFNRIHPPTIAAVFAAVTLEASIMCIDVNALRDGAACKDLPDRPVCTGGLNEMRLGE
eukprot:3249309-Rhodomonas_salina.2